MTATIEAPKLGGGGPPPTLTAEISERVGRITFAGDRPSAPLTDIFTREETFALWEHCSSGNGDERFVTCCDFTKGAERVTHYREKKIPLHSRLSAAYRSACGLAKPGNEIAVAHYTQNANGETVFGAADFDAHHGEWPRAESYALSALVESFKLRDEFKLPDEFLFRALEHTGGGFRLSLITMELIGRETMGQMLRFIASRIGCEIAKGVAEFSPDPFSDGGEYGRAVKLPGSFNPARGMRSTVLFHDLRPLVDQLVANRRQSKTGNPQLPEIRNNMVLLPPSDRGTGEQGAIASATESLEKLKRKMLDRYPVSAGQRNDKMVKLVGACYELMNRPQILELVRRQHDEGRSLCHDPLAQHEREAEGMLKLCLRRWRKKLNVEEEAAYDGLTTDNERDCFRILRGWSIYNEGSEWTRFSAASMAVRIGVSRQAVDKLRQKFEAAKVIECKREGQKWFFRWLPRCHAIVSDDPF